MGLSLNYELRLPATMSEEDVERRLRELHQRASSLGFDRTSPVLSYDSWRPEGDLGRFFRVWAEVVALPLDEEAEVPLVGDAGTARGFVLFPGRDCEAAVFAVLRRAAADGRIAEWYWGFACKTQYASIVSDEHLIACHTSLVALLDYAIECGWGVVVNDESNYWETRDTAQLVAEVHAMNRLVAGFAGRLSDAMGSGHSVRASIFDHPDFEHLEMGEPADSREISIRVVRNPFSSESQDDGRPRF